MPTLTTLKNLLEVRYQVLMQDIFGELEDRNLIPFLYEMESPENPNTHLRSDERNLLVYVLAKQMGLDDNVEIPQDFIDNISTQLIYAPNFNALQQPVEPQTALDLAIHINNVNFTNQVKQFLMNRERQSQSFIVSVSTSDRVNESHFVEFSLKKDDSARVTIAIKDSILADHSMDDSPELAWQKAVIRNMIPQEYHVHFVVLPVTRQDAADCLIHAVNNDLQEHFGIRHELNVDKIAQARKAVASVLSTGFFPEQPDEVRIEHDEECMPMVNKLRSLTQHYQSSLTTRIPEHAAIQPIVRHLLQILDTSDRSAQKIFNFYKYLDTATNHGSDSKNIDTIKQDPRRYAKNFLTGVALIAATLVTGVLPGLLIIGIVWAATGRHPGDLLKAEGERFDKELGLLQGQYSSFFNMRAEQENSRQHTEISDQNNLYFT